MEFVINGNNLPNNMSISEHFDTIIINYVSEDNSYFYTAVNNF